MTALSNIDAGQECEVVEIRHPAGSSLDRILAYGLSPGTRIRLHQRWPAYVLQVGETDIAFDSDIATGIFVRVIED